MVGTTLVVFLNLFTDYSIDDLIMKLDFRDSEPEIVDLSPKDGLVSTFQESRIECIPSDKVRSDLWVCRARLISRAGCIYLLLSASIPGSIPRIYVGYRWDSSACADFGTFKNKSLASPLPDGTKAEAEKS